jgi:hypothetical protein
MSPVFMYGIENCFSPQMEKQRLMVLREIFVPKRGSNSRLEEMHNEELHNLYSSLNRSIWRMIKSMRMRQRCISYVRDEKCKQNFSRKS